MIPIETALPEFDRCPNSPGSFKGIYHDEIRQKIVGVATNLTCKSWSCPFCRPIRLTETRYRIYGGNISQFQPETELEEKYAVKMITLTYPGKLQREKWHSRHREIYRKILIKRSIELGRKMPVSADLAVSPQGALDVMNHYFHLLITALHGAIGGFLYLKVVEPQQDGFPHFHVLLVGKNIVPKTILEKVKKLWCIKYHMGFIWVTSESQKIKSIRHAIRYITKYMSKGVTIIRKKSRIFTASRGALMAINKPLKNWIEKRVYIGRSTTEGVIETDITDKKSFEVRQMLKEALSKSYALSFFDDEADIKLKLLKM